jgi:hypothetical protein
LAIGTTLYDDTIAGFLARKLPSGAISYGYRYRANGKQPLLALGVHGSITASDARRLAQRAAGKVAGGRDPQEEKAAHRAKVANSVNMVLDTFMARYVRAKGLRSADGIEATFRLHVRPAIGGASVYDVTRARIIAMLDEIEDGSGPVAAHTAYKFTSQAFTWWALRDERFRSPFVKGMGRIKVAERAELISERSPRRRFGTGSAAKLAAMGFRVETVPRRSRWFAFRGTRQERRALQAAISLR